jgi:hypothetical protein
MNIIFKVIPPAATFAFLLQILLNIITECIRWTWSCFRGFTSFENLMSCESFREIHRRHFQGRSVKYDTVMRCHI